ncbi:MAG: hypothetical protein NTW20_03065 [Rhodobacterales bacterium]|nr:hypothetical protein [Rhodobacterales bacterium]
MKILLHMGMPKTGSTSLQHSLHASSDRLRESGVFYPQFGNKTIAHHLLLLLHQSPSQMSPFFLQRNGGPKEAVDRANAAWEMVRREVQRRRPEVLVLSSELLILPEDPSIKARIADQLSELSGDIVPILYVRHPVQHFRSNLQQLLKVSNQPVHPHKAQIKDAILETEAIFSNPLQLVAFDRSVLHGGDVVADFATRFLSPWIKPSDLPEFQSNVSLSAEALVFMAQRRREGGNTDEISHKVSLMTQYLRKLDREDPPSKPMELYPEAAEAALRSAVSHRWLSETGRLQIPGLDVSKIDGAPLPDWMVTAAPDTLFPHDPARLDRLRAAIEAVEKKHRSGMWPWTRPTDPWADPKPRKRDLLLRFLQRKLASVQDRNTGAAP